MSEVSRRHFLRTGAAIGLSAAAPSIFCSHTSVGQIAGVRDLSKLHYCTQFNAPVKGAARTACIWRKRSLTVCFLEGDSRVQDKVRYYAPQWTPYSGVQFVFWQDTDADIRITFNPNGGSSSYVGRCDNPAAPQATMNFGWLTPDSNDVEDRRVVLHEFGHALGLVHEHQNPTANINWNKPAVYEYYRRTQRPPWDTEKVDYNIFRKYSEDDTNFTAYDGDSIMLYGVPSELTLDGRGLSWNTDLSQKDKRLIREIYGN